MAKYTERGRFILNGVSEQGRIETPTSFEEAVRLILYGITTAITAETNLTGTSTIEAIADIILRVADTQLTGTSLVEATGIVYTIYLTGSFVTDHIELDWS